MAHLPQETWLVICAYLESTEDVKSFRLVGKAWAAVGLEYLVRTVSVVMRTSSLLRLERIATHPVLGKRVQKLKVYTDIVPKFTSLSDWQAQAHFVDQWDDSTRHPEEEYLASIEKNRSEKERLSFSYLSFPQIRFGWTNNKKLHLDQKDGLKSDAFMQSLEVSVAQLKGLRHVDVDQIPPYACTAAAMLFKARQGDSWYLMNILRHRHSFTRLPYKMFPALVNGLKESDIHLYSFSFDGFDWRVFSPAYGFTPALQLPDYDLKYVGFLYSDRPLVYGDSKYDRDMDDSDLSLPAVHRIHQFLAGCGYMRGIEIEFSPTVEPGFVTTRALFQDTLWPFLYRVALHTVKISGTDFLDFLSLHRLSLRELALSQVWLEAPSDLDIWGDWIEYLAEMSNVVSLSSLTIYGILQSDTSPSVNPEKPTLECPQIPVGRVIRYLLCKTKTDFSGQEDEVSRVPYDWNLLGYQDIEDGYSSEEG